MAGIQFTLTLDAIVPLTGLSRLEQDLAGSTELMDSIGRAMVNSGVERIALTNTAPDGSAWVPSRRAREKGGKTLLDSGMLMRSINSSVQPDQVKIGTNLVYAGVMHEGAEQGAFGAAIGRTKPSAKRPRSQDYFTPLPWADIPARRFLGFSDDDELTISGLVEVHYGSILEALQ